jgi:L-alanine-DL-glutamate epimerase-like enolase superfamily enzyme
MAKIVSVSVARIETPLRIPFVTSLRRATNLNSTIVRLTDSDGLCGYGEAPGVWRVTGESVESIEACVLGPLASELTAWDLERPLSQLARCLDRSVVGNAGAKAACEVAVHDLASRHSLQPLHHLLGASGTSVATDWTVPADALPGSSSGGESGNFSHLKVKVGLNADDLERVRLIHAESNRPTRIRIDANQGWDIPTTIEAVDSWLAAGLDIEFVEQPLDRRDLHGHAILRKGLAVPLMLDEAVFSVSDLQTVVDANCADMINIKLAKCGGFSAGRELAHRAQEAGIGVMVGSMLESILGVSAAAALAATVAPEFVHDVDAAWWSIPAESVETSFYVGDRFRLSSEPGLEEAVNSLGSLSWVGQRGR